MVSNDEYKAENIKPNIETLLRRNHEARFKRLNKIKKEQRNIRRKIQKFEEVSEENKKELEKALSALSVEKRELKKLEILGKEFIFHLKVMPWNVDTISKPGFTKTILNTPKAPPTEENMTEEEKAKQKKTFIKENTNKLKVFSMLKNYKDSYEYLEKNPQLVCEDMATLLGFWCVNLQMEGKSDLLEHVAHQTMCMEIILETSRELNIDPRAFVPYFFSGIQVAEKEYKDSFEETLNTFKDSIQKKSEKKILAKAEIEEEERKARIPTCPVETFQNVMPWNVDTISKPGFTKTILNTPKAPPTEENMTEEEKAKRIE